MVSLGWFLYFFYDRPETIRVAVTQDSVDHRIIAAASKLLRRERANIRFKTVLVKDPATSAKTLESGNADLAIIRTDLGQPVNGKAIVIMRRSAAVIAAPAGSSISSVASLRGKRIGVLIDNGFSFEDRRLLKTILAQYNVPANVVQFIPLEMAQVAAATKTQRIDAVFMIGAAGAGPVADVVGLIAGSGSKEPVLLSISQSYAIAQASPAISAAKIVAGAFGGAKPRPGQSLDSVAVTTLLMADAKLHDTVVSAITRAIFSLKPRIAASIPAALRMEAPSTSKDAALSVHPGAAAFLDGEDLSLVMRYGDYIYLAALLLSMVGSAIAALLSHANRLDRRYLDEIIVRLMDLLAQTRMADSAAMLKLAELEVDAIVASALTQEKGKAFDSNMVSTLSLAVDQVRDAIRDRRAEIRAGAGQKKPAIRAAS
jgi:TRAP-type uncharacterized transport system substrate-binding protein